MSKNVIPNILDKKYTLGILEELSQNQVYKGGDSIGSYLIVTNNKTVLKEFENTLEVEGNFMDVLEKTRELVYLGHKIVSYPLAASIRMMYSPVRSILVSSVSDETVDSKSIEIIDSSIEKYRITMGKRNVDARNKDDYEIIDYDLIISAISENDFMKKLKKL